MPLHARTTAAILCLGLAAMTPLAAEDSASVKGNPDFSPVTAAVDTNRDGRMARDEWEAAGLPESSFNMFEKGRGYVTQEDYDTNAAPAGIDLNGDGALTVEEFVEFDKKMSAGGPPPGGLPPGGPPPGGPQQDGPKADGPGGGGAAESRPVISDVERVLATQQIQNLYSKHAYYHALGWNLKEIHDLWVSPDGPNAKTATFTNPFGIWEGLELITEFYGTFYEEQKQKTLDKVSKEHPEIENIPANLGVGMPYVIHTQTTPIIEVAGDGQTAKGMWYSPGIAVEGKMVDGRLQSSGGWFFEKYAVDFARENGEWKIWHIGMYYDPTPPGWGDRAMGGPPPPSDDADDSGKEAGEQAGTMQMVPPTRPNPDPYTGWTPTWVPRMQPALPEPYYTFSETFSY